MSHEVLFVSWAGQGGSGRVRATQCGQGDDDRHDGHRHIGYGHLVPWNR